MRVSPVREVGLFDIPFRGWRIEVVKKRRALHWPMKGASVDEEKHFVGHCNVVSFTLIYFLSLVQNNFLSLVQHAWDMWRCFLEKCTETMLLTLEKCRKSANFALEKCKIVQLVWL